MFFFFNISTPSTVRHIGLLTLLTLALALFATPAGADVVGMGPTADGADTTNPASNTVGITQHNTTTTGFNVIGIDVGTTFGTFGTSLTNAGTVSIIYSTTKPYAQAYGILDSTGYATITNTGTVSVTTESGVGGTARPLGITTTFGNVINKGTVIVSGTAAGIPHQFSVEGLSAVNLDNSGTVQVTATATAANPWQAYGLHGQIGGLLINSGTVTVTGSNSDLAGITSGSLDNINSGTVTASSTTATGNVSGGHFDSNAGNIINTASGTFSAIGGQTARGVWLEDARTLHNYGTISATGGSVNNYAIHAEAASNIHLHSGSNITGQIFSANAGSDLYLHGSGPGYDIIGQWDTLTKESAGTMSLGAYDLDGSFASLAINGGTLALGRNLDLRSGNVQVASGATLDIGSYRLTGASDVQLANGSTLRTTLGPNGTCGFVNRITGIDTAATLALSLSGVVEEPRTYLIAGSMSDYNALTFSNGQKTMSTLFDQYAMNNTGGTLGVEVTPVSDAELAAQGVNPGDARAIQKAFKNDQVSMDKLSNMSAVEAREVLKQAHVEPMQGAFTAVLNGELAARDVIANRLLAARSAEMATRGRETGLSSGSDELLWKFWAQGFGSFASESAHGGGTGYNAHTSGLTLGMDKALRDDFRLGLAYTYIFTSVDSKSSPNVNDVNSNMLTLYGEKLYGDDMYLDGHISLGMNKYEAKRYMTALGLQAKADFDGTTFNIGGEFGKSYSLSDTFVQTPILLTPYVGVDYSYISIDSYEESGAGASNLIVAGTANNIFATTFGTRLATTWDTFTPEVHVAWVHDWANEKISSSARFASGGAALSSEAVSADADKLNLGVGLAWQLTDVCALDFTADYLGSAHMDSIGGTLKVSYEF